MTQPGLARAPGGGPDRDPEGIGLFLYQHGAMICAANGAQARLIAREYGASLALYDRTDGMCANMAFRNDGEGPYLALKDRPRRARRCPNDRQADRREDTAENVLTMYDAKGNVIWQAPPRRPEDGK